MLEITLILLLLLLGLVYAFMTWNYGFWRKRNVPGPSPRWITGNYPHMYNMKRHTIYDLNEIYSQYKHQFDAIGIFKARCPQLMVINPQLARRIFVSDFKHFHDNEMSLMVDEKSDFIFANNPFILVGDEWKQRRADVTPGLTMARIKAVYPVTNEVCRKMSEWLRKQIRLPPPEGINGKDLSLRFTTEMVTDCVLGLKAESFSDKPSPIMGYIKGLFTLPWTSIMYFMIVNTLPTLRQVFKMRLIPLHIEHYFVNLMQTAIDARRQQLAAGKQFDRVDYLEYILQLGNKKNLDTRHLTAHTMTFLLDGFETTATVLSHLLLLLGRDEQVQQQLREELEAHLNAKGIIDFEMLNELPFLDACVQEAIRLFPLFVASKLCTEPIELPNKKGGNFTVERGTTVIVPHCCFMLDEEYFPNPQDFKPERFMQPDAARKYREQGVFMGFGDGPRVCIGMRFALIQIKAALVETLTKFNVRINPKTRKDILYDPMAFVTTLQGGIWLDFEARQ
ncbi:probable cytochrome P450 28a5 [Drosophila hydei]|uniref:Probable cytochrome P450 28a5 n=1 Tax=Drosophila hydei TaxID=7224 RepID=A0A6J1M4M5_DROHY|nr:probable cytochrome P450 28a5 [Drosophila hydei]